MPNPHFLGWPVAYEAEHERLVNIVKRLPNGNWASAVRVHPTSKSLTETAPDPNYVAAETAVHVEALRKQIAELEKEVARLKKENEFYTKLVDLMEREDTTYWTE